jgi:anti-sigma-K factor RskA
MSQYTHTGDAERGGDVLAGEYVLGLLSGEEWRVAQARFRTDTRFVSAVEEWNGRLAGFAIGIAPVAPGSHVWAAIDARLFEPQPSTWTSLGFWRALTAISTAVAAASLAVSLMLAWPARQPALVASLQATDAGPSYLARIDTIAGRLTIRAVQPEGDAQRVPELWVIPPDGTPRSLGVIGEGSSEIAVPEALKPYLGTDATLAISLEPQGGSPTGQPTGPVIAAGRIGEI